MRELATEWGLAAAGSRWAKALATEWVWALARAKESATEWGPALALARERPAMAKGRGRATPGARRLGRTRREVAYRTAAVLRLDQAPRVEARRNWVRAERAQAPELRLRAVLAAMVRHRVDRRCRRLARRPSTRKWLLSVRESCSCGHLVAGSESGACAHGGRRRGYQIEKSAAETPISHAPYECTCARIRPAGSAFELLAEMRVQAADPARSTWPRINGLGNGGPGVIRNAPATISSISSASSDTNATARTSPSATCSPRPALIKIPTP